MLTHKHADRTLSFPTDDDLKEEQPFYFHGEQVMKFDDLIKFVQFDVSEMPKFKVKEEDYNGTLDGEIRRIR